MSESNLQKRRSNERRQHILSAARERADEHGWATVTTRHLADAIGYSQPVLYGHFPGGKDEIKLAVALEGFVELTAACRDVLTDNRTTSAVEAVATVYLDFANKYPATYEAMFLENIDTPFASDDTRPELREGFEILSNALGSNANPAKVEVYWSALHGMSLLERAGRMRPEHRAARIAQLGLLLRESIR